MGGIGSPNLPLPETRHLVLLGATDWGGAHKGLTKAKETQPEACKPLESLLNHCHMTATN